MSAAFGLAGYFFIDIPALLAFDLLHIAVLLFLFYSVFVAVVFSAYDLLYMEIPDQVVIPFLFIAFIFLGVLQLNGLEISYIRLFQEWEILSAPIMEGIGTWYETTVHWYNGALAQGMLGMLPIFGFFLALILISSGRWLWGGDLRIALYMGFVGGAQIAWLGLFAAYIVGSIVGIGLIATGRGRKTMIPFGPFLAIGLWVAMFFHWPILEWYYSFLI
jgi:prepilin signal peptidase PulO-like enzyme (type II secretory pathway)